MSSRTVYTLIGVAVVVLVQNTPAQQHKAGLWEVTSKTSLMQRGDPEGHFKPDVTGEQSRDSATLPACYTGDLINQYGVALPPSLRDCELLNVVRRPESLRADVSCAGTYNGKGSLETVWIDENHITGKVHFTSKSRGTPPMMIRWTQDVSAVFKGADCGSIRPRLIPAKPASH